MGFEVGTVLLTVYEDGSNSRRVNLTPEEALSIARAWI